MIRVLVADGHAILRRGLKQILLLEFEDATCAEAGDAQQAFERVRGQAWDLVILGNGMPGQSSLEVLGALKQLRPELPVLMLSMYPEDRYGKRALRAGAAGYVNKETTPEELVKAIRKVLAGRRYVSAALAEKLASDLSADAGLPSHEKLSDREFEVLRMIASGKTNLQIAQDLHLSVTTVSTYRARILEKMRMTTNGELMRYALQNGLID